MEISIIIIVGIFHLFVSKYVMTSDQSNFPSQKTFTPKSEGLFTKRGRKKKPRNINYTPTLTIREPIDGPKHEGTVILGHDEIEALRLKGLNSLGIISAAKQMGISKSLFATIYNEAIKKVSNALIYGKSMHIELRENDEYQEPLL